MDFSFFGELLEEETEITTELSEGYRNLWVAAEVVAGTLPPSTLEAIGQAREMASQIGVYVWASLIGDGVEPLGQQLIAYGADKVLVVDDPVLAEYQPEIYVKILADLIDQYRPEILLMPATSLGNDLAPRLAQRLNTGLISHCIKLALDMSERLLLGTFPVLGGEVHHTFACPQARPQMATLQPGYFRLPNEDPYRSGEVRRVDLDLGDLTGRLLWLEREVSVNLPPVPLSKARIVVSAGRGMGDIEGFALVQQLADALDAALVGSRGAFDEGWIAEDRIVGVGGQFIAPDLYIACGLSGDIYHYFGIQNAKCIVAINPDENAPIMKVANMAIVGDARQVIPAMLKALAGR